METAIELRFSLPPAGMRRNHESNRWAMNALKDQYSRTMYIEWLKQHAPLPRAYWHASPLNVAVTWRQCGEGDVDNTLAALKPLFDNLGCAPATKAGANRYYLGVYESDNQIKRICVEREKVAHRSEEGVVVTITKREEG